MEIWIVFALMGAAFLFSNATWFFILFGKLKDIYKAIMSLESTPKGIGADRDPFLDDVMDYALDRGLYCALRPGMDGKPTLYHMDEEDGTEYSVTQVFTTNSEKGTSSYDMAFKEMASRIDGFLENRLIIKNKTKCSEGEE